jgi:hypothetical protein
MFLVDNMGVRGRLKYMELQCNLGELSDSGQVHMYQINVPASRALEGELGFLVAHTPGAVAGVAGESEKGQPWITILQYWVSGNDAAATEALDRALARVGGFDVVATFSLGVQDIRDYYREEVAQEAEDRDGVTGPPLDAHFSDVTYALHGLAVELTGYPLTLMLANYATGCAFPDVDHLCRGDVHSDVMCAWVEQSLAQMMTN